MASQTKCAVCKKVIDQADSVWFHFQMSTQGLKPPDGTLTESGQMHKQGRMCQECAPDLLLKYTEFMGELFGPCD